MSLMEAAKYAINKMRGGSSIENYDISTDIDMEVSEAGEDLDQAERNFAMRGFTTARQGDYVVAVKKKRSRHWNDE